MKTLIYVRASAKDQDAYVYEFLIENIKDKKLNRPVLSRSMNKASERDILLVESIDRLSCIFQSDFEIFKTKIKAKGLKLRVIDLPTTHHLSRDVNDVTDTVMEAINNLLINLFVTMAHLNNDKRKKRIKQ